MALRTKIQIALTFLLAAAATAMAASTPSHSWLPFWLLLLAVTASSSLKVVLPSGDGSMSLNYPFILLGIIQLSPLQAILLAALSVAAQRRERIATLFQGVQLGFNVANAMLSTACAFVVFASLERLGVALAPALALASVAYFLYSTISVAMVLSSSRQEKAFAIWAAEYPWYLPFYLVGAVLAALVHWMSLRFGWGTALLLIPSVYTLYRAYMGQVSRLQERQQHLEETEALHLRTIEGLAMAIEAKDQGTHDHLFRVRHYVRAVGHALKLSKLELQALETAAFLHDIGKLAVPEQIINKPGKLTPEEFEKMKIHPVVGADILERVRFPYPVVPIVRSHHEWFNGTGYPDGIQGTEIPIGARILTVVDCFDALVSDRPYRKGLSDVRALDMIRELSGRQFDPDVVKAFEACHAEAGNLVPAAFTPLVTDVDVSRGMAPGAGFEAGSHTTALGSLEASAEPALTTRVTEDQRTRLAAAVREAQRLVDLKDVLGSSLMPEEAVSVMASRLRRVLAFEVCGVYLKQADGLKLRCMDGENALRLRSETIPLGEGISGWVAQSGKPLLNGNATIEPGCPLLKGGTPALRCGLSIPLFDPEKQVLGVLTLYCIREDAFSREDLRVLTAIEPKLAAFLQHVLWPPASVVDTDCDSVTGLPDAKHLYLSLEAQLETCEQKGQLLTVVMCHLDQMQEVRDYRGQKAGDRLLRAIANVFQQQCSGAEMVASMGGNEFVFLLPNLGDRDAKARFTSIAAMLAPLSRRLGQGPQVTASLGVASYPFDGAASEVLLAAASQRMYLDRGRNLGSPSVSLKGRASAATVCNG